MSEIRVKIDTDPPIEVEIIDPKTAAYYVSQHAATVVERILAAVEKPTDAAPATSTPKENP